MAVHTEIVPSGDPALGIGLEALRLARMRMTSNAGSSYWPMGDGTGILLGDQAQDGANRVDANGNQLPLIDTSRIEAEAESASKKADEAIKQGEQIRQDAQAGVDDVRKQAQDAAAKAEQTRQAAEAGVAEAKADAAASGAKAEQVRKDTETMVRAVRDSVDAAESKAQNASEKADKLAGSITDVTATVNGHSTRLKELSTKVEGAVTQNGQTVESVTELKQTVTGMRATVTQNSKTATDALSKATSVEATANGLKTQVTQNSKTASDALSKATSVEQTANGITATLSKDYQTAKAADAKYSTKTELTATSSGLTSKITEAAKKGDAAMSKVTTLEQTANGLSAKVGETAKTLDATVQTVNQVKSTADSNKATISQVSTTANDALSRTSSLEQNLSGFKSEVGQTYATKSDMGKQSSGSNLWCNQLFDPDKPQITRLVDNVTAPNGSRTNLLAGRDHFNAATGFPVVPGHTYVITAYCKPIKGGKSLRAGLWYTQQTSGHPYDGLVGAESTTPLDDGWMTATWRFTCPYGKSRGCVYFQIDNWPPNNASTQWLVANVTCTDVTGLQPAGDYATNSSLSQTADSIKASVAENARKADAAMSKATTVEQTAKGLSTQITETARKADTATATANTAKSTADSNSQRITQTANTADSALSKATTVEQSLNGFKTSVQTSYQPWSMSDELVLNGLPDPGLPSWTSGDVPLRDGCYERTFPGGENHVDFSPFMRLAKPVLAGHRYLLSLEARATSGTWADRDRFVFGLRDSWNDISVKGLTSAWRLYQGIATPDVGTGQAYFSSYAGSPGAKTVQMRRLSIREVTWEDETYASKTSLTQTADSIKASVAENARKADAAMSKASSVEQTASGLSTRISEVARKGDQTVQSLNTLSADVTGFKQTVQQTYATGARVSRLESSLDGFRSTVSQTYSPKSEVTDLAASTVRRYRLNMTGAAAWYKIGFWQPLGQGSVAAIHVYTGRGANGGEDQNSEFTIMLKKGWVGSSNNHRNDYGVNLIRQRNAANVQVKAFAYHPSGQDPDTTPVDIWIYQPWGYGGGHYDVSYDGSWSHQTTVQKDAPVEDSTHTLQVSVGYETLSNTSYVDQTSRSVSLGVVEEYKNGRHGSALATSADITAAKDSITSTVSSTYATKTGVTQEISSKITQNNNSLDVRFATKTETRAAQDTANTANSHASDAQSRVGSLESCIRMTSAGVRVGHIVNGGFQGYSALVSSQGSFDVLDYSGRTVATFRDSILDLLNGLVRLRNANNTGELLIKAPDGTYGYLSYNSDGMFLKSPTGSIRLEPKPGCNVFTRSKAIQPSQSGLCNKATDANGIISVDNLSPPDGNANNGILSVTVTPINIGQDPTLLAFTPVIWAKGANGFQVRLKTNNNTWVSGAQPYAFCWHVVWA